MSAWNCPSCTHSLLEAPPGTTEQGVERPPHLEGAATCSIRCGHSLHVECLLKLEENAESGRPCPVCHQDIDIEQTNPVLITQAPAGAPSPTSALSGIHQGSGDTSTESSSNSGLGGNPSTQSASAAFGGSDDLSPSAKRPRDTPKTSKPRLAIDPPQYFSMFLDANPHLQPYFTPEMISRLNAHTHRIFRDLPLQRTLASTQTHLEALQETVDAINRRSEDITEEQVTQAVVETISNLFLDTEPDRLREMLKLVDGWIQAFDQWLNDNFIS